MRLPLIACLVALLFSDHATAQQKNTPRINHFALYTQNLQKSTIFYRDLLELDTIPEPFHDGKHTWFNIGSGGAALHLIEGLGSPVVQNKNTHLCFSVPSLETLIRKLTNANIPYEDWPGKPQSITTRVDGVHQIYFKDLDGHWIEVNDEKKGM